MQNCQISDKDLATKAWAQNLINEYGPQVEYFLNNGSSVEKKLAEKVKQLAEAKA